MKTLLDKMKLLYSGKARGRHKIKKMLGLESTKERFEYIYKNRL